MKPIVFHTLCWRSKEICLFCVLFFRPLISRNIWLKGPFCRSQSSERVTKEPQQAAYRIIHKTIHQGQSILQSSTLAYWILSGIDPGTNNDLNYHRVPVPSRDRHLGQWASPPAPPPPPLPLSASVYASASIFVFAPRVSVCVSLCLSAFVYVSASLCVCLRICVCLRVRAPRVCLCPFCVCLCLSTYLGLSVSVYVSASVFVSLFVSVCVCLRICVCLRVRKRSGSVHACFLSPRAEILRRVGAAEPGRRPLNIGAQSMCIWKPMNFVGGIGNCFQFTYPPTIKEGSRLEVTAIIEKAPWHFKFCPGTGPRETRAPAGSCGRRGRPLSTTPVSRVSLAPQNAGKPDGRNLSLGELNRRRTEHSFVGELFAVQ